MICAGVFAHAVCARVIIRCTTKMYYHFPLPPLHAPGRRSPLFMTRRPHSTPHALHQRELPTAGPQTISGGARVDRGRLKYYHKRPDPRSRGGLPPPRVVTSESCYIPAPPPRVVTSESCHLRELSPPCSTSESCYLHRFTRGITTYFYRYRKYRGATARDCGRPNAHAMHIHTHHRCAAVPCWTDFLGIQSHLSASDSASALAADFVPAIDVGIRRLRGLHIDQASCFVTSAPAPGCINGTRSCLHVDSPSPLPRSRTFGGSQTCFQCASRGPFSSSQLRRDNASPKCVQCIGGIFDTPSQRRKMMTFSNP